MTRVIGGIFGLSKAERNRAIIAMAREGLPPRAISERLAGRLRNRAVSAVLARARKLDPTIPRAHAGRPDVGILPPAVRKALIPAANARRLSIDDLAVSILKSVARDGLVDAILDDGVGGR